MRDRILAVAAVLAVASLVGACGGGDAGGAGGAGGVPSDGAGGAGGEPNEAMYVGAYCCAAMTSTCCMCGGNALELSSDGTYVERAFESSCCDMNSSTETAGEWQLSPDGESIITTAGDGAIQHWTIQSDGATSLETDGQPPKHLHKNEACTPFTPTAVCGDPDLFS